MIIDPSDPMDREFYLNTYDPWLRKVIRDVARPGDTCLDVGAHKGYVAMFLARRVGIAGRVIAFEPDPRARNLLEEHRRGNRLQQLTVSPYALGQDRATAELSLSRQLGWSSLTPNETALATVVDRVSVAVRSLDGLLRDGELDIDPNRLTFVKIDAEGSEPRIIAGMRRLLRARRPVIWLEINRGSLEAAGASAHDVERELRALGFDLYVPRRFRRFGMPRVTFAPFRDSDRPDTSVFDVVAAPPGFRLARAT